MVNISKRIVLFLSLVIILIPGISHAQGPQSSYYYSSDTELDWASAYFYLSGGSRHKFSFLPVTVTGEQRYPIGIANYSKDVALDAPVVFIGNGIDIDAIWNSYSGRKLDYTSGDLDVTGKVVMFCYDAQDAIQSREDIEFGLDKKISAAAARGAAGIIVFSWDKEYPFPRVNFPKDEVPDIPAICVTRKTVTDMLEGSGLSAEKVFSDWAETGKPESFELIARINIKILGAFKTLESDNIVLKFRDDKLQTAELAEILKLNEQSVQLILGYFRDAGNAQWNRLITVYFSGYDSKVFYTHHWGRGLAAPFGVFNVHEGGIPDFGLIVHENTHIFCYMNWGFSSSFMSEGIAKYTEALSTDPDANHAQVRGFIEEGSMLPLSELVDHNIGQAGQKTIVGYPAAGSFVAFLVERFGMSKLKDAYSLENRSAEEKEKESTWSKVFGKSLSELDSDWLKWLAS